MQITSATNDRVNDDPNSPFNPVANSVHDDRRNHVGFMCHACGMLGHRARFCTQPRLTGLMPLIPFASFSGPPEDAWANGVVAD